MHFGTLTLRSVHPASPDELTPYGPLATRYSHRRFRQKPAGLTNLKFENRSRKFLPRSL